MNVLWTSPYTLLFILLFGVLKNIPNTSTRSPGDTKLVKLLYNITLIFLGTLPVGTSTLGSSRVISWKSTYLDASWYILKLPFLLFSLHLRLAQEVNGMNSELYTTC